MKSLILCTLVGLLSTETTMFGQVWTLTGAPTNSWTGIAMSADGSKMFASCGDSYLGRSNVIYASIDSGLTWTPTTSPSNRWTSVACSADATKVVAITRAGFIFTSTNSGITWRSNNVPKLLWRSVASSADGSHLFVETAFNQYYRSPNFGFSWISNSTPGGSWTIACSPSGLKVATGVGGNGAPEGHCTSIDGGVTWATNTAATWIAGAVTMSADGTKLYAPEGRGSSLGLIHRSMDGGATWIANDTPTGLWESVACSADGNTVIACNFQSSSYLLGSIYTSFDAGVNWISNNVPIYGWRAVACSADGSTFAAVSERTSPAAADYGKGYIWIAHSAPTPKIRSAVVGNSLGISWTIPATNCVLQKSADLTSTNWQDVGITPSFNLNNLENTVTVTALTNSVFFRLATP